MTREEAIKLLFQSTLPVWGATIFAILFLPLPSFQSTLPVWGATKEYIDREATLNISIHAPRVGSDQ